jgi:hypothetical protein
VSQLGHTVSVEKGALSDSFPPSMTTVTSFPSITRAIPQTSFRAPLILFTLAIGSCLYQLTAFPLPAFGAYHETLNLARTLANTGTFANPFTSALTGPTAHLAPLLPSILAVLIRLLGYSQIFVLVTTALMVGVIALHAALLPSVSQLLFGWRTPGIWAGALAAILPIFQITSPGECLFLGAWLLLFLRASARAASRFGPVRGGIVTGCFAGLLLLWNPSSVIVMVVWTVRLVLHHFRPRPLRWKFAGAVTVAACLTCLPWTVRTWRVLGAVVFIRDNLGLELRIANNDQSGPTLVDNLRNGSMARLHPNFSPAEAGRVVQSGEDGYNRLCMAEAAKWSLRNPGRFTVLTLSRILRFWIPAPVLPPYAWSIWLITALSAPGLMFAWLRREPAARTLGAILLFFPVTYYFIQADDRYRYPILWVTLLLAGYALAHFTCRAKGGGGYREGRPRTSLAHCFCSSSASELRRTSSANIRSREYPASLL